MENTEHTGEARLSTILEESRDMIIIFGAKGEIRFVNRSVVRLLGFPSKDKLIGAPLRSLFDQGESCVFFLTRLRSEGFVEDLEIVLRRTDGSPLYSLISAIPVPATGGSDGDSAAIIKDITEIIENQRKLNNTNVDLVRANDELKRTQAMMVQQEKLASIGQLAAGVAHEINNPLAFLRSNFAVLRDYIGAVRKLLDSVSQTYPAALATDAARNPTLELGRNMDDLFSDTEEGFVRIINIVQSLLSFSRVDVASGFEQYDVNKGIESTLAVLRNEIKYVAKVTVTTGDIPFVSANGSEINQVLLNVLLNAVQAIKSQLDAHTRSCLGEITIRTSIDGKSLVCEVRDDGPGIPTNSLNRVFEPFYTTKPAGSGTGLGLSISYDIVVKKHGGRMWAVSDGRTGASFFFMLPLAGPSPTPRGGTSPTPEAP
ncbi:MAG TPA: ATP-binding protein [Spirochaetia bacterium]|nr:ATP-binding protein [Spirochaetia bacterium]